MTTGDTNLAAGAEAVGATEPTSIDEIFDDISDVTVTEEEETGGDTQPAEDKAGAAETQKAGEPAQGDKPAQAGSAEEPVKLTYRGETKDYSREQLIELAQKGLDYDGVRADRDRLRDHHPALEVIDLYARQNNMTREQYLDFARQKADEREAEPTVRQLMGQGVPEAAARELALRRMRDERATQKAKEDAAQTAAKRQQEQDKEARTRADYAALVKYGKDNGIDLTELPREVIRDIVGGMTPLDAYLRYENRTIKLQLEQLTKNQANKTKNPGPAATAAPEKEKGGFDDAFDEIFGF